METSDRNTAVGVFPDRNHAEFAVEELLRHGFVAEQIGFILPADQQEDVQAYTRPQTKVVEGAEAGAMVGGVVGLLGAAVAGVLLPGAGTVIAGGVIAGLLGGAAGMTGGGILGALIGLSVPEDEARLYERDFHLGNVLVTVHAKGRYEEAVAILQQAAQMHEPPPPHRGRGRLAVMAEPGPKPSGTGSVFVPEP